MKTSIRLNNDVAPSVLLDIAAAAEEGGFDQLWVSHDLLLRSAPVLVATVAAHTSRLHLGIGILNPYTMHPAEVAMAAATLQEVSDGRFLLGLAAGATEFMDWVGLSRDQPLRRTREALRAIRALTRGERPADIGGAGEGWTEEAFLRLPQQTDVPIYLGAMSPRMLELAGAEADGALPLLFPPERYPDVISHIATGARESGRSLHTRPIDVAACVWVSVHDDIELANRELADKLAYYGPSFAPYVLRLAGVSPQDFDPVVAAMKRGDVDGAAARITPEMMRLGISGTAANVTKRCRWLLDNGATHLSFGPPLGPDPAAAVAALGRDVVAQLRPQVTPGAKGR